MGDANRLASLQSRADDGDSGAVFELGKLLEGGDLGARAWCEAAAERNCAEAMCVLGDSYRRLDPPDLAAARSWYEMAAGADEVYPAESGGYRYYGRMYAMYWLGTLFEILSDPSDPVAAQEWYRKAAESGSAASMIRLAKISEEQNPPDLLAARKWYEKAAMSGDAEEMYEFADFLVNRCDPPELTTAREWYQNVRDITGDPVAAFKLGELCGTLMDPPDLPSARGWYEFAINFTDWDDLRKEAEYRLAVLLETRWDPPDLLAAKTLYGLAALSGKADALRRLASLVGRPVTAPDFSAACAEWEAMANAGDADAAYLLGVSNQSGLLHPGVTVSRPNDLIAAIIWYRQAAEARNVRAMVYLAGLLSSKHDGLARDLPAARAWLEKAAGTGDADAMYELGSLLRWEWEPPDESTAQEWFVKAAAAGNIRARIEI